MQYEKKSILYEFLSYVRIGLTYFHILHIHCNTDRRFVNKNVGIPLVLMTSVVVFDEFTNDDLAVTNCLVFSLSFGSYGLVTWINTLFEQVHLENESTGAFYYSPYVIYPVISLMDRIVRSKLLAGSRCCHSPPLTMVGLYRTPPPLQQLLPIIIMVVVEFE
jgi:hypothetical protein